MLPVLDLASGDHESLAHDFDRICRETGFLAVTNHGVSPTAIERAWETAEAFFRLPSNVKARIAQGLSKNVLPMLADGRVKVVLDSTFPLKDVALAHTRMDEGTHIGKIVLRVE